MKCIVNNIATCREYLLISASVGAPDQWVCLHLNYCYKQLYSRQDNYVQKQMQKLSLL